MKELFHIKNAGPAKDPFLLIRLADDHAGLAIADSGGERLSRLHWLSVADWTRSETEGLSLLIAEAGVTSFSKVAVMAGGQAFLAPIGKRQEDYPFLLSLLAAPPADHGICRDEIPGWQIVNYYAAPSLALNWVKERWPSAIVLNPHTVAIRSSAAALETGQLQLYVGNTSIQVTLVRSGRLLLSETAAYQTQEDVLYYLLRVCERFGVLQQEVILELSGFIDVQSALYKEISQYFLHTGFAGSGWDTGEHPAHFFTNMKQLSLCV